MSPVIQWLDDDVQEPARLAVGGKGANLASMIRAGLPVPPGFVVTTDAQRLFVRAAGLEAQGPGRAGASRVPGEVGPDARALRDRTPVPEVLESEILASYSELGRQHGTEPVPVAVRSSATAEDGPSHSFAGAYDTSIGVRGGAAVVDAVKKCWLGTWNARAVDYMKRRGLDPARVALAVVVQRMVAADAAGVMFTVNPMNGNQREVVINAVWGLGTVAVDGRVTPDTVVVDKATRRVLKTIVGDKQVMELATKDGTAQAEVKAGRRRQPVLSADQVAELVSHGCTLESHLGGPQDVEWAWAEGQFHILQSRPATSLPGPPAARGPHAPVGDDRWPALEERPPQDFDLWTQVNVGEIWPRPVTPLMWSGVPFVVGTATRYALRGLRSRRLGDVQWARRLYGRAFYNEGAFTYILSRELGLPASFVDGAVGSRRGLPGRGDERFHPVRLLRSLPFLALTALSQMRAGKRLEAVFPQIDRHVADFMSRSLDDISDRQIWDELSVCLERFVDAMNVNTELSVSSMAGFGLLQELTTRWCGEKHLAHDLVAGLSGIRSAEMGLELSDMAQWLDREGLAPVVLEQHAETALRRLRDTPEAEPFLDLLDAFLGRHGHHCLDEGEWLNPRWIEEPQQVLQLIAGYLKAGGRVDPAEAAARQRQRRTDAVREAEARLGPIRRRVFHLVRRTSQRLVRLRENGKNCYVKALSPVRRRCAVLGARWSRRGVLNRPADVFFLTMPEVERLVLLDGPAAAGLDVRKIVAERRKAFEYWMAADAPEVVGPDLVPYDVAHPPSTSPDLQGIPISSGRARGKVRVLHDPAEAVLLCPGEILVARATDPGWTPLFPLVAGLVVEIGGQLSHAAIVAREYGLPAVANVPHARQRLRDGDVVTVNGTTGHVYVEETGPRPP